MDVSGTVRLDDWRAVRDAVCAILGQHLDGADLALLGRVYADIAALYRGEWPGFRACDMPYHDLRHVLDVSLAMARLLDGHQRCHAGLDSLGSRRVLLGMVVSLCHDVGYLRNRHDTRHRAGAEYTRTHVSRGGRFLAAWLPRIGLGAEAAVARRLVQFTGYEVDVGAIRFDDPRWVRLGRLIGSADILAQMADACYLDRCRDRLFPEFAAGGMTHAVDAAGNSTVRYHDALDLLRKTPGFMHAAVDLRLGQLLGRAHVYAAVHFGGRDLYMHAIARNRARLEQALHEGSETALARPFRAGCAS
jgi:hypothetical protein